MEQYNALLAAAPLIESVLTERTESTVRPIYDGEMAKPAKAEEEEEKGKEEEEEDDEE